MLESLRTDLRFAARMLARNPLFTIVAVFCLSLGIGAVTTIVSAMNALVLRPLGGVSHAERLMRVERKLPTANDRMWASYPWFQRIGSESHSFAELFAWGKGSFTLRRGAMPGVVVYGSFVSGNLFSALGVRPALGRFFSPDEDRTELSHPVIVVSEKFWRTALGADSSAVGRQLLVNGHTFTLIGVAPATFEGLEAPIQTEAWVPLQMQPALRPASDTAASDALRDASASWLRVGGRLATGASASGARAELRTLSAAFSVDAPEPENFRSYTEIQLSPLSGLPPDAKAPLAGFLGLLLGAAFLALIIASVNVAAMLSARGVARQREMAMRAALGAGSSRLARQLLTEILALFALGAAGGVAIAIAATRALERIPIPAELPISLDLAPDLRVAAFAVAVSLLMGIAIGLAPARRAARAAVTDQLRNGSAASSAKRSIFGDSLVVAQLSLSLLLLVCAGLFTRALEYGRRADLGFDATHVTTAAFDADSWGYDEVRARTFYDALRERLTSTPGVLAASYATDIPLSMQSSGDNIQIDGVDAGAGANTNVQLLKVDGGYFESLRLPLVAGREIASSDKLTSAKVAVVNETLARSFGTGATAIGRTLTWRGQKIVVVGIARDATYASIVEATPPLAYLPLAQAWTPKRTLIVRTTGDPAIIGAVIQESVRSLDAFAPRPSPITLQRAMAIGLLPQHVAALVTGVIGTVGLILAAVGLYGIIAFSVGRRTREIGIRLALGARARDISRMVVLEGMRLALVGLTVGLLLAATVTRLLASLLFGIGPLDAFTYVTVSALFAAVALFASWLPARRAASASPTVAMSTD